MVSQVVYNGSLVPMQAQQITPAAGAQRYGCLTAADVRFSLYQDMAIALPDSIPLGAAVQVMIYFNPSVASIQADCELPANYQLLSSLLIKAPVPVFVLVRMELDMPDNELQNFDVVSTQAAIAKTINRLPMGRSVLYASDLTAAVKAVAPKAVVMDPVSFVGRMLTPQGTLRAWSGAGALVLPVDEPQVVPDNVSFVCIPSDVQLNLR